jgi:hypothetical protein
VTIGGVLLPCSIRRQQLSAVATTFPLAFAGLDVNQARRASPLAGTRAWRTLPPT